jgi:hypothetical protein
MISFLIFACGQDPILDRLEAESDLSTEETFLAEKKLVEENSLEPPKPAQPKELITSNQVNPSGNNTQGTPSSEPTPGIPNTEPTPGIPQEPAPGNPFKDGPMVKMSGQIIVPNWNGEPIRIDIFDGDQQQIGGQRPNVVMMEFLPSDGAFQIDIPERDSPYWIGAYVDVDRDGKPGPNDPSAWYSDNPIMGNRNTSGVILELSVQSDNRP